MSNKKEIYKVKCTEDFMGMRDENGFTPEKARELREADKEARESKKSFNNPDDLIKFLLS
jgi:hypothetical protein